MEGGEGRGVFGETRDREDPDGVTSKLREGKQMGIWGGGGTKRRNGAYAVEGCSGLQDPREAGLRGNETAQSRCCCKKMGGGVGHQRGLKLL